MIKKYFNVVMVVVMVLLASTAAIAKEDVSAPKGALFRYKNEKGTLVTSHILPPEMAYKGYQVVNATGDVLKTVAPAPTEQEKGKLLQAMEQEKNDKALLLRYGTLADLMKTQKRKKDEMSAKLSVLTGNQSNIKLQIESEQSKAANYERQGQPVPEEILTRLEGLWGNLERTEDQIRILNQELANEEARYAKDLDRYKQLKGLK